MVPKPAGNEAASIWLQKEPFMRVILLAFGLLMLSACATTKKYEALLNTWAGKSENALLQSWGPPDSFYENDGVKYLTFNNSRSGYVPGVAPNYQTTFVGNTAYTQAVGGSPGFVYTKRCKTTFAISGGIIRGWRYQGNACRSNYRGPKDAVPRVETASIEATSVDLSTFRNITPYSVTTRFQCNLLNEPGFKGAVVAELSSGLKIEIQRESEHWLFGRLEDGRTGYVARRWVAR
tara:strand:- start:4634 stop:5338 length:705 start_codon:yes stop_codon:yes gene_type:complete